MNLYEIIKNMSIEEMQNFLNWVYSNGFDDGLENAYTTERLQNENEKSLYYRSKNILTMNANDILKNPEYC